MTENRNVGYVDIGSTARINAEVERMYEELAFKMFSAGVGLGTHILELGHGRAHFPT